MMLRWTCLGWGCLSPLLQDLMRVVPVLAMQSVGCITANSLTASPAGGNVVTTSYGLFGSGPDLWAALDTAHAQRQLSSPTLPAQIRRQRGHQHHAPVLHAHVHLQLLW